jgi:hypothetical protein
MHVSLVFRLSACHSLCVDIVLQWNSNAQEKDLAEAAPRAVQEKVEDESYRNRTDFVEDGGVKPECSASCSEEFVTKCLPFQTAREAAQRKEDGNANAAVAGFMVCEDEMNSGAG